LMDLESLKCLNLYDCSSLSQDNVELLTKLEEKHHEAGNFYFRISWPNHFLDHDQNVTKAKGLIKQAYKTYLGDENLQDSILEAQNNKFPTFHLFHRFLSEDLKQRGQKTVVSSEGLEVATIIAKHPHLLEVFDEIASYHNQECVNQPVFGFLRIAALASAADEPDMQKKLDIIKRTAVIHTIEQEVKSLENNDGNKVGAAVEVELGNAMIREVYKHLEEKLQSKTGGKWLGVNQKIAYEGAVSQFLSEDNIKKVANKVNEELERLENQDELIAFASGSHLADKNSLARVILGEKGFEERGLNDEKLKQESEISKQLTKQEEELKRQYVEFDSSPKEAEEIWQEIRSIQTQLELSNEIGSYLASKAKEKIEAELEKSKGGVEVRGVVKMGMEAFQRPN